MMCINQPVYGYNVSRAALVWALLNDGSICGRIQPSWRSNLVRGECSIL